MGVSFARDILTAEDRIHLALLLTLCAANAVLLREPSSDAPRRESAARAAVGDSAAELSRAELDAAITRVQTWLEHARGEALVGSEQELALRGLGPSPQDRSNPERWLSHVLGPEVTRAWLSDSSTAAVRGQTRAELTSTLVILLETGVPMTQPLATPSSERAAGLQLGELVGRLLEHEPKVSELGPSQLDLLSLAVLGGLHKYQDRLARTTQVELRRLDLAQRTRDVQPGAGDPTPEQLEKLANEWRSGAQLSTAVDLHWSAAVFRSAAVLDDKALDEAAQGHLRALLGRYRSDRALHRYLEATARNERERSAVQLAALEHLGRFEEALYNAHLSFRQTADAAPGVETARVMRLAARDLVEQWQNVEAAALPPRSALPPQQRTLLIQAAVQALRGLRGARVAS
ncbi:MAG: hypothetical protein RL033_1373 [Pseudomonadota bacterium]|jgi:hypothetical protein